MQNTSIYYMYRDASNYKAHREIVVEGSLSIKKVLPYLNDGEFFIPSQIGMEDIQDQLSGFPSKDDHCYHTFEAMTPTDEEPTETFTAEELLSRIKQAHAVGWDEVRACKDLGIK